MLSLLKIMTAYGTHIECCFRCSKEWKWCAKFNTRTCRTETWDNPISLTQPKWKQVLIWKGSRSNCCKTTDKALRQKITV